MNLNNQTYIPRFFGENSCGRAVIRNRQGQYRQIQRSTLQWSRWPRRIFQKGVSLFALLAVCHPVGALATPPLWHSTNGTLITAPASGYRNNGSGALTNVGSNGNYWSFAPISQTNARNLNFNSGNINPLNNNNRANGFSVRPVRAFDKKRNICLFENCMVYTYDQIHKLVTAAYLKAREHERATTAQLEFEVNLESNLAALSYELFTHTWKPLPLDWFVLQEPSVREVFAPQFRDRVVSHVLFSLISPIFERYFIRNSHSCRAGMGTLDGITRFEHNIRSVTDNYRYEAFCLNLDISGYFMSIVRERLFTITWDTLSKYRAKYPDAIDYGLVEYLTATFLFRDPLEGCVYHGNPNLKKLVQPGKSLHGQPEGCGIPIGDVINQLNSNIYLNPFDQFVVRLLKIYWYNRYVDDSRLLHRDYHYLEYCKEECGEFLDRELCLKLHPKKSLITSLNKTNYFLGAAILPYRRYATNETIGKFRSYVNGVEGLLESSEAVDLAIILSGLNSHLGYLQHFNERKITEKILSDVPAIREHFAFTDNYKKAIIKPQSYEQIPVFRTA